MQPLVVCFWPGFPAVGFRCFTGLGTQFFFPWGTAVSPSNTPWGWGSPSPQASPNVTLGPIQNRLLRIFINQIILLPCLESEVSKLCNYRQLQIIFFADNSRKSAEKHILSSQIEGQLFNQLIQGFIQRKQNMKQKWRSPAERFCRGRKNSAFQNADRGLELIGKIFENIAKTCL